MNTFEKLNKSLNSLSREAGIRTRRHRNRQRGARRSSTLGAYRGETLEARQMLTVDFIVHEIGATSNVYTDSMRTGDFDGDGDLDFAFAQNDGEQAILSWYENVDGKGTFDEVQGVDRELITWIEVDDMDGDGDLDLVSSSYDSNDSRNTEGRIAWYENDNGFFGEAQLISDQLFAPYFDLADVDGDGDIDVVSGSIGIVTWHENNNGSFETSRVTFLEEGSFSFAVVADDLDGDGDVDVVWSSYENSTVGWSENTDGKGTFGNDKVLTTNATIVADLAAADLDNDGDSDIVIPDDGDLSVATNSDGMGNFNRRLLDSGEHFVVETADIDGDGDLDLVTDRNEAIVWYENTGNANFGQSQIIADFTGKALQAAFPADMDGDGDIDILANVGNYDENNSGKIFWYENQSGPVSIIGDSNGDGKFDSSDLVAVFVVGEYEDDVADNSTFEDGDWNGDGEFDTADLVLAFQESEYEPGAARAVSLFAAITDDLFHKKKVRPELKSITEE